MIKSILVLCGCIGFLGGCNSTSSNDSTSGASGTTNNANAAPTVSSVQNPTFSLAAGTYTGSQTVLIACPTMGAVVHYTVDGTEPGSSSTRYTGVITISKSTTLQAFAVANGYNPSGVARVKYTIQ